MPASRRGIEQVEEVVAGERARGEEGKGIQGRAEQSRPLPLFVPLPGGARGLGRGLGVVLFCLFDLS